MTNILPMVQQKTEYLHFRHLDPKAFFEPNPFGGFTVAVHSSNSLIHTLGIAKCSKQDRYERGIGRAIADSLQVLLTIPNVTGDVLVDLYIFAAKKGVKYTVELQIAREFLHKLNKRSPNYLLAPVKGFWRAIHIQDLVKNELFKI